MFCLIVEQGITGLLMKPGAIVPHGIGELSE
jgi:hypothetical protein